MRWKCIPVAYNTSYKEECVLYKVLPQGVGFLQSRVELISNYTPQPSSPPRRRRLHLSVRLFLLSRVAMRRSERIGVPNRRNRDAADDDDEYEEGEEEEDEDEDDDDDDDEEFSISDDDGALRSGAKKSTTRSGVRRPPPPHQPQHKKRKVIRIDDSDSSESDSTYITTQRKPPRTQQTMPPYHSANAKVREVLNRTGASTTQLPKSILKRATKYVVAPPDAAVGGGAATKRARPAEGAALGNGDGAVDLSESHRRPTKQRGACL